jgi:hypothetical protein
MPEETDSTKMLEWAEKAGLENLRYHLRAADELKKESNTT